MSNKSRWVFHLSTCYRKGWEAAEQGKTENDNPYVGSGVGVQRRLAWRRGFTRKKNGLPFSDING